jgi:ParB-like chromosome segregation protein Spo0J
MKILKVPIEKVKPWDKNPRGIRKEDFERLKRQIVKLGIYKPLVCYEENGEYVTLGGNMRLRALMELGVKEVEISVVKPKNEAEKIEYSLSDNDRAGYYEDVKLAELIYPHISDIDLNDFKVDLGNFTSLKNVIEEFGPDFEIKEKEIDENIETQNECPRCGYKW